MAITRAKDVLREFSSELAAFEILLNHGGSNDLKTLTEGSVKDTWILCSAKMCPRSSLSCRGDYLCLHPDLRGPTEHQESNPNAQA